MDGTPKSGPKPVAAPRARPLYAQVKALIVQRLIAGQWRPGAATVLTAVSHEFVAGHAYHLFVLTLWTCRCPPVLMSAIALPMS